MMALTARALPQHAQSPEPHPERKRQEAERHLTSNFRYTGFCVSVYSFQVMLGCAVPFAFICTMHSENIVRPAACLAYVYPAHISRALGLCVLYLKVKFGSILPAIIPHDQLHHEVLEKGT